MYQKKEIQYSEPNDGTNDHAETLPSTQSIAITNPILNNHHFQPHQCSHQVEEHCNSDGCRQDCVVSVSVSVSTAILPMKKNPQILRTESLPKSRNGSFDTKRVNEASPGKKEQISSTQEGNSNPKSFNPHHNKDKVSVSPKRNSITSILNGHESPARMCQSPRYIPSTAAVAVAVTSDFASAKEKNHENEKASNDSHPDDTTTNSNTNTTTTTDTDTQDKHSSTSAVSSLSLTMDALSDSEENPRLEPEAAVKSNSRSGPVNKSAAYSKSHFHPIFASPPHSTTDDIENNTADHMTTSMNITRIQASSPAILRSLSPSQRSPNLSLSSQINSNVNADMTMKQPIHKPELKLTLSAFRKPESAVRLTSAPPSKVLSNDYDLTNGGKHPSGKILGHGASSTVRLATHRLTGRRVAVKCIGKHEVLRRTMTRCRKRLRDGSASSVSSSSPSLRATLDEYEILSSLTDVNTNVNANANANAHEPLPSQPSRSMHENIIHLIDLYETESEIHLVLEYCAGGELFDAIQKRQGESESDAEDHNLNRNRNHPQKSNLALSYRHTYSDTVPNPVPIPAYTESQVARIASQLLSALAFLHSRDIVHRDVKPENILLVSHEDDNLSVKLSDFGLARVLRHEGQGHGQDTDPNPLTPPSTGKRGGRSRAYSRVGSDYYAAPEISFGGEQGYDSAVDMYSLGVTLYILLCGHPPSSRPRCGSFVLDRDNDSSSDESNADGSASVSDDDDDDDDKYGGILPLGAQIDFPIRLWRHISPSAKNLVKKMLRQNPDKRIKAADALKHDWILLHKNDTKSEMKGKEHEKNKLSITPMPIARIENPLRFSFLDEDVSSSQLLPVSPLSMSAVQGIQLDYLASKLYEAKGQQEGDFLLSNSELTKSSKSSKRRRGNSVDYTNDAKQAQGRFRRSSKKLKCSRSRSKNQRRRNIRMSDIRIPAPQHSLPVPLSLSMVELYNRVSSVADAATAVAASLESVDDGDNDDIVPTADEVGDGGSTCHFHENGQVHEVEVEVDDDTTDAATAACSASNNTMAPLSV